MSGARLNHRGSSTSTFPLISNSPSSDFVKFSEALDRVHDKKVHIHCAANYRVSAFYALHMVSRGAWSAEQAMTFIGGIWQPGEHPIWSDFIAGVLAEVNPQQRSPAHPRENPGSAEG